MDTNDRQAIEELFARLDGVERSAGAAARDPEAEALIRERMTRQTGASYYMAQTIIVQEHALHAAHEQIEHLQRELSSRPPVGGGFLASLFGGGQSPSATQAAPGSSAYAGPSSQRRPSAGLGAGPGTVPGGPGRLGGGNSGFLAGAAQTAMGVAGGVVLGGLIAGALSGGAGGAEQPASAQQAAAESEDSGEDFSFDSEAA